MKTERTKISAIISLILNCIVVILEAISFFPIFINHESTYVQYYTQDSNFLAFIICILCVFFSIRGLRYGNYKWPQWLMLLKYIATCCLMVTFVVVIFILAPSVGITNHGYQQLLLKGNMLYHHLLCPVLSFISFVFFEKEPALPKHAPLFSLVPTIIYAIVAVILNIAQVISGPYPFLMVYQQPIYESIIWGLIILTGAFGIAIAMRKLNSL